VAKLFGVFCVLLLSACATTPSDKDLKKAETHYNLGVSYLTKEQLNDAFVEFQKAVKLDPKHKESLNSLGYLSFRFKKYDEAISYYKRSISIDPNYSEALNNLGALYLDIENWDEAIKYFKMALKNPLYTTPEKAYSNMGYAYYRKGDYTNAINILNEVFVRYPDGFPQPSYFPYYVLGLVYVKVGNISAAIGEFKKALDIAPEYINTHWELAHAYLRIGDKDRAVQHFQEIVEKAGNDERSKEASEYIELLK
jgi:Tfp pilus assembly protein PilF